MDALVVTLDRCWLVVLDEDGEISIGTDGDARARESTELWLRMPLSGLLDGDALRLCSPGATVKELRPLYCFGWSDRLCGTVLGLGDPTRYRILYTLGCETPQK